MHLVRDPFPCVRVRAIYTVTSCLELVKSVPCSDANIFPEYVLPGLAVVSGIWYDIFWKMELYEEVSIIPGTGAAIYIVVVVVRCNGRL
jgi:phosphoinositide-3-kinase regulatory subunit 4